MEDSERAGIQRALCIMRGTRGEIARAASIEEDLNSSGQWTVDYLGLTFRKCSVLSGLCLLLTTLAKQWAPEIQIEMARASQLGLGRFVLNQASPPKKLRIELDRGWRCIF